MFRKDFVLASSRETDLRSHYGERIIHALNITFLLLNWHLLQLEVFFVSCNCSLLFVAITLTYYLRGIVADSEDTIKSAADALGRHGFINYFGLQVLTESQQKSSPCKCIPF